MHVVIRKIVHVTEFGIFSITVFCGVRAGWSGWRASWAFATLVIAVAYASLDEWHQSFVPLREARARDVAIDALGALLTQSLVWFYATRRWKVVAQWRPTPSTSGKWLRAATATLRNDSRHFVRISALVSARVHCSCYIVVGCAVHKSRVRVG